ncbi:MAG TPA: hypothetical protein VLB32_03845 [Candidatus Acidoferrales bacterium]|nr:hypothetical protein [Candidatus Acidoferrales bacterium]
MLIDEALPAYDVAARYCIGINAPLERVYDAVQRVDLTQSTITRWLLALRGLSRPSRKATLTLADVIAGGFIPLAEDRPREFLLGLVGKFWTPTGCVQRLDAAGFRNFSQPGFAKAVWNFSLREKGDGLTELATETRVLCLDAQSRRRFRLYWFFVGPFSGWMRKEALRLVKQEAERKRIG